MNELLYTCGENSPRWCCLNLKCVVIYEWIHALCVSVRSYVVRLTRRPKNPSASHENSVLSKLARVIHSVGQARHAGHKLMTLSKKASGNKAWIRRVGLWENRCSCRSQNRRKSKSFGKWVFSRNNSDFQMPKKIPGWHSIRPEKAKVELLELMVKLNFWHFGLSWKL